MSTGHDLTSPRRSISQRNCQIGLAFLVGLIGVGGGEPTLNMSSSTFCLGLCRWREGLGRRQACPSPFSALWASYLHRCLCVSCVSGTHRGQETVLNLLELQGLEGQMVMSPHPTPTTWVLGTEPESSARAERVLNPGPPLQPPTLCSVICVQLPHTPARHCDFSLSVRP